MKIVQKYTMKLKKLKMCKSSNLINKPHFNP